MQKFKPFVAFFRSVASVGLPLLLLASFLSVAAAVTLAGILYLPINSKESDIWLPLAVGLLLTIGGCVYLGAGTTRVLARTLPLRCDGRRRLGVVTSLALFGTFVEGTLVYVAYVLRPSQARDGLGLAVFVMAVWAVVEFVLVGVYPLGWTVVRHLKRPTHRGVIYLRRFGGRGDAGVLRLLLGAAPAGVPVAFIAGPASQTSSWDPLLLAFAGLRWSQPWSNVPLFLTSDDRTWERDVLRWIAGSKAIVLDSSDQSSSILAETDLIDAVGAGDRTISLLDEKGGRAADLRVPQRSRMVSYELSWSAAAPRTAIGIAGVLAGIVLVGQLIGPVSVLMAALLVPTFLYRSATRPSRDRIRQALIEVLDHSDRAARA
jgi:hypothetical protein